MGHLYHGYVTNNQRVIDVAFHTGGLGKDRGLATIFAQSIDTVDVDELTCLACQFVALYLIQ
jgi:hypothetical protein